MEAMQVTIQLIVQNDIFANKKGVKTLDCSKIAFMWFLPQRSASAPPPN